jgi:hypothetical protein
MSDDLNLIGDRYDWLLTIFYIPYIVFEFLGIMWKVVPPHIWATFVVFLWYEHYSYEAAVVKMLKVMALGGSCPLYRQ